MMSSRITCCLLALVLSLALSQSAQAQQPSELLKFAPTQVNTVAVINVAAMLASQRAVQEGWSKIDQLEYLAGAVPVHPSIERILLAKEVQPESPGRGYAAAVVPLKKPVDLKKFAETRGGSMDTIADEPVSVTDTKTIGVKLQENMLGFMRTESRQEISRWIDQVKDAKTSKQSRYINSAIANFGTRFHILIAVDLQDLLHPNQVSLAVARSETLLADKKVAESIQGFFSRLNGIRFGVNITTTGIIADLRFDSRALSNVNLDAFKMFIVEVFERNGALLEDLRAAKAKVEGENTISLTFQLSDPELARIMAILAPPVQGISESDVLTVTAGGVNERASRRYFQAVNKIIDDLKRQNKNASEYERTAIWHDSAANQIDTVSILGVEPELIEYGRGTAYRFRAIVDSLRGVPIASAALQNQAYYYEWYQPAVLPGFHGGAVFNPWAFAGPQSVQTNLPEIRKRQAELVKKDADNRAKLWQDIDSQRARVRKTIADKSGYDLLSPPKR